MFEKKIHDIVLNAFNDALGKKNANRHHPYAPSTSSGRERRVAESDGKASCKKISKIRNSSMNKGTFLGVIITGIPLVTQESLNLIFNKISMSLGMRPELLLSSIVRLNGKNNAIRVKFIDPEGKLQFFTNYIRNHRYLTLEAVLNNFKGNKARIWMEYEMDQETYALYKKARALKKAKKIFQVKNMCGNVQVKVRSDSESQIILGQSDLDRLCLSIEH